jgi:hypothetical protein
VEARQRNLVEAIARGESVDALLSKLKAEEARKKELVQELSILTDVPAVKHLDRARLKRDLKSRVADANALLRRNKPQARQMLKKLIGDKPLICVPFVEGNRRGYRVKEKEVTFDCSLRRLPPLMWCPQRDVTNDLDNQ